MSLTNAQYDEIMRQYNQKQLRAHEQAMQRKHEIYSLDPRLAQIDARIASVSVSRARNFIEGNSEALLGLENEIADLSAQKYAILAGLGFSPDDLEPAYECPDCKDTGYINGHKCHCFRQAEVDYVYKQSNLRRILQKENFQTFRLDYYSPDMIDPESGVSSLDLARHALDQSKAFVRDFSHAPNLIFSGSTGTGKTFLTNCIAKELLEAGHSVIYFSSFQLFDILARNTFSRSPESSSDYQNIFGCDLLIIDDLGTEMPNSFTISQFFQCLNVRLQRSRSTIISTNLSLGEIADIYSERISSRITSSFTLLKLFGEDIRILKKLYD